LSALLTKTPPIAMSSLGSQGGLELGKNLAEHLHPLTFWDLSFLYLLNYKTYRLKTLQVTVLLQLDCGKNNS
jgi:hypothetical protein